MSTVKLTLSMPADVVALARECAERQGTSISGMVRKYVERLAQQRRGKPSRRIRAVTGIARDPGLSDAEMLKQALMERHKA